MDPVPFVFVAMDSDEERKIVVEVSDSLLLDKEAGKTSKSTTDGQGPPTRPNARLSLSALEQMRVKECKISSWLCNCHELIGTV